MFVNKYWYDQLLNVCCGRLFAHCLTIICGWIESLLLQIEGFKVKTCVKMKTIKKNSVMAIFANRNKIRVFLAIWVYTIILYLHSTIKTVNQLKFICLIAYLWSNGGLERNVKILLSFSQYIGKSWTFLCSQSKEKSEDSTKLYFVG